VSARRAKFSANAKKLLLTYRWGFAPCIQSSEYTDTLNSTPARVGSNDLGGDLSGDFAEVRSPPTAEVTTR